jgi:hypothetical protein
MSLKSQLFRGDRVLEACLVQDSAHVTEGASGIHVAKIHAALIDLDGAVIDSGELFSKRYGHSTASSVLSFKQKRQIINRAYQTKPDNIVGKMTISAMDNELFNKQEPVVPRFKTRCGRV